MEPGANAANEDYSRVLIPGWLHSKIHRIFIDLERRVQTQAARQALDRCPDAGFVRMNAIDVLEAIRTAFPRTLADLERELVDQHDAHVRRAS
jgi:hypothetical protein